MRQRTLAEKLLSRILPALVLVLGIAPWANAEHYTATPIQHLVVIFQENVSFDHYFGTYPYATNPPGEPDFHARFGTPTVNGLLTSGLLNNNPNSANPQRLDRSFPNSSPATRIMATSTNSQPCHRKLKQNFVDHGVTDQSSVLRFIEDNWGLGRIGNQSTDAIAGSLLPMFDFSQDKVGERRLILNPSTGQPVAWDHEGNGDNW